MKMHSKIGIIGSVLLLTGLLFAAFYVPGVISRLYDNRTLGQMHSQKLDLTTYQVSFGSFEEKLYAIGSALEEGELILSEPVDVLFSDSSTLTQQMVLQEADKLLLQELQLGFGVSNTFKVIDSKRIDVSYRNEQGEMLLPDNQVYLLTCICTELSVDKGIEYPELYYMIPHITLWVDAEFGKLYGLYLVNAPISSEKTSKVEWKVDYREALINYWELGRRFQIQDGVSIVFDSETEKKELSGWGENLIFMEQNSCLRIYMDTVRGKTNFNLRVGMPPFIYDTYDLGYNIVTATATSESRRGNNSSILVK